MKAAVRDRYGSPDPNGPYVTLGGESASIFGGLLVGPLAALRAVDS